MVASHPPIPFGPQGLVALFHLSVDSCRKFLRVAGCLWLAAVLAILIGALTAPYIGRMVDFVLYQTTHREWVRLALRTHQSFFDLSSPERTVKSYYSALYRSDAEAMHRITAGLP